MRKAKTITLISLVICLFAISLISAGIADWFNPTITGKASNKPTNVSVNFKDNSPAVVQYVSPISAVDPTEDSYTTVYFSAEVYNFDKLRDINFSSVYANFSSSGEARYSAMCTNVGNLTNRIANFSCSIDMWYWDVAGTWDVVVQASDLGNGTIVVNDTTSFTYNQLKALVISPEEINWNFLEVGALNQTSIDDPTTINNTGNYNGTIDLTAFNLIGEDDLAERLDADNFSVGLLTGSEEECGVASSNLLANNSLTTVTGSIANRGNLSLGGGVGQEDLYYCIREVPNIPAQTYSTLNSQSWIVSY